MDAKVGEEVLLDDRIGSSNVIEGYVPQSDRISTRSSSKLPEIGKGLETKSAKPKNVTDLEGELCAGIYALLQETTLKSSLKSLGSTRSVTWADEEETDNGNESHDNLCDVQSMGNSQGTAESSGSQIVEDMDSSVGLASAEACANALIQAAEVVACGEFDASDDVSESRIIFLPQPMNVGDTEMVENDLEPESAPLNGQLSLVFLILSYSVLKIHGLNCHLRALA